MKIFNIILMSGLLAVVAAPVAFGYTGGPQKVTAVEYLKTHEQMHKINMDGQMAQSCSMIDARCGR